MANVMFKRGTQSALQNLIDNRSTFTEGTFYLTTDSDRLYFAQSASELVLLNHQVIHVASVNDLPSIASATVGDFYYAIAENVLCTKSATSASWVQINKNTNDNDNTKTTGLTFTKSVDTNNKDITLNYTLKQKTTNVNGESTNEPDITGSFVIKGSDIASVVTSTSVGVTSAITDGKAVISTTGEGANTAKQVNIAGSGSVTIGGSSDNITITGENTTYDLTSAANSTAITLGGSDNSSDSVTITNGKQISVTGATENEINIAHGDISTTKSTGSSEINDGGNFTAITEITTDNGHITGYKTNTYTVPTAPEYSITGVSADNTGKISVSLKEKDGLDKTTSSGADLYYMVNGDPVYNQGSIEFYTKDEIDRKINGIDAMVYRGTVGDTKQPSLPTDNVRNGDTYKTAAKGTFGGHNCDIGDLLIATGTEGPKGTIIGDIVWTYVPSGDDVDTTYQLKAANNVISLHNDATGENDGTVTLDKGTDIEVNTSGSTITIGHATKTVTTATAQKQSLTPGQTFTAITGISNSNGHLDTITPTQFTLPADTNTTYTLGTANGTATNSAKINLDSSDNADSSATIQGGTNISVSGSATGITIAHATPTMNTNTTGAAVKLADGGTFDAITSITKDSQGHVTNYKLTPITIPTAATYSIANPAFGTVDGGYSVTTTLTSSGGSKSTSMFSLASDSLKISNSGTTLAVNLEWGTF